MEEKAKGYKRHTVVDTMSTSLPSWFMQPTFIKRSQAFQAARQACERTSSIRAFCAEAGFREAGSSRAPSPGQGFRDIIPAEEAMVNASCVGAALTLMKIASNDAVLADFFLRPARQLFLRQVDELNFRYPVFRDVSRVEIVRKFPVVF